MTRTVRIQSHLIRFYVIGRLIIPRKKPNVAGIFPRAWQKFVTIISDNQFQKGPKLRIKNGPI